MKTSWRKSTNKRKFSVQISCAMGTDIILQFLKKLSRNNNREWFEKNKEHYWLAKSEFEKMVFRIHEKLIPLDPSLEGLDPKKFIFRIYRDVRFSKDKRPYKTNMGAGISPTGKGLGQPGYYFHLEPGNKSFVAGGLFMPAPDLLAKVRQEIDYNGKALEKIFQLKAFKKYYPGFWEEDTLKTAPKGYPKDHPLLPWLKLKSFIVTHEFKDKEVQSRDFLKNAMGGYSAVKPLLHFLRTALD